MRPTLIMGLAAVLATTAAAAQEVTLRAVSAFAEKTTYSRGFELFIERVNRDGKGVLQINYIGGPKAMPPFEVGNALKSGVVDVANSTGAFYTNVMPEADAWKLTERPMSDLRKNGGYDYMAQLYAEKMNAIFLARHVDGNPFHLYLNKPISSPDLTGLKIRITPVYRDFFQALPTRSAICCARRESKRKRTRWQFSPRRTPRTPNVRLRPASRRSSSRARPESSIATKLTKRAGPGSSARARNMEQG